MKEGPMLSNPDMPRTVDHMSPTAAVLDNVVFTSLTGPHARLAQRHGRAVRYPAEVSGFAALPDQPRQQDWSDLAQLANTARGVAVAGLGGEVPEGWNTLSRLIVIQMVDEGVDARPDAEVVRLTSGDVPEMLDLVEQTQPGPFAPRTIEMGTYLGFRSAGQLIAMAGERFHPHGWTEISAVCTAPEARGRGLATRLVHAVAYEIRQRGDTPFLHVAESNTKAIALYEALGFKRRRRAEVVVIRPSNYAPADLRQPV
jgi:ribosomal protein S18 acetylase RimI-like enzyme